jgi:hypothetical protein
VRIAAFGALTIGLVALALAVVVVATLGASPSIGLTVGLALCSIVTAIGIRRARHAWTPATTAGLIESRVPGLDNLLVTFVELARTPERASGRMREEVARQAADRAERVRPSEIAPMGQAVAALVMVALGTIAVVWSAVGVSEGSLAGETGLPALIGIASVRARVTPPAYLGMAPRESENPERLEVPAGSTVRLEVETGRAVGGGSRTRRGARPLAPFRDGRFALGGCRPAA